MTTNRELCDLISLAKAKGAVIETRFVGGCIIYVKAIGVTGVGNGWMPPIQAAERLREFVYGEESKP